MENSLLKNVKGICFNKPSCSNIKKNILMCKVTNKQFCLNLKTTSDLSIKNTKEINPLIIHIDILNLPKNKLCKKTDLEILKQSMMSALQNNRSNKQITEELERKLISIQHLLINYEKYSNFVELRNNSDRNPTVSKNEQRKIEIIKKDDRFIINLNDLAQKNIYLGVMFNKRIRAENPDKVNNLIFVLAIFSCGFILWMRFMDFKLEMQHLKPYGAKPLINFKVAKEKGLNIEDLNFIYENTDSYELDEELQTRVENYRRNKDLYINPNYRKEVKKCKIVDK